MGQWCKALNNPQKCAVLPPSTLALLHVPGTVLTAVHPLFHPVLPAVLCPEGCNPHFTYQTPKVKHCGQRLG